MSVAQQQLPLQRPGGMPRCRRAHVEAARGNAAKTPRVPQAVAQSPLCLSRTLLCTAAPATPPPVVKDTPLLAPQRAQRENVSPEPA